MHLDDAPIKKAPSYFRLGLSNIGLISAAYNFGSTPPLEGGGVFQAGLNYGGGDTLPHSSTVDAAAGLSRNVDVSARFLD